MCFTRVVVYRDEDLGCSRNPSSYGELTVESLAFQTYLFWKRVTFRYVMVLTCC